MREEKGKLQMSGCQGFRRGRREVGMAIKSLMRDFFVVIKFYFVYGCVYSNSQLIKLYTNKHTHAPTDKYK